MKIVLGLFCVISFGFVLVISEEDTSVADECCSHVEGLVESSGSLAACQSEELPQDLLKQPGDEDKCRAAIHRCCAEEFRIMEEKKKSCADGIKQSPLKLCASLSSEIGAICCEECSFGTLTGKSRGKDVCPMPPNRDQVSWTSFLRQEAAFKCCLAAAEAQETTSESSTSTTSESPSARCAADSCAHTCEDDDGVVRCSCRPGYRLQPDRKSCNGMTDAGIDINECAEAEDDLCTAEDTVCHNVPGAFKCVPLVKRDLGLTCPPGFKRNVQNQVCDDINECQLPRPPCPKYLCENTIGGYKCSGKPGKPFEELTPGAAPPMVTEPPSTDSATLKDDICPPGFREGANDECDDIDECKELSDDCQRLSQHCINTHGGFFCQDHVSKRCAPGFMVNAATGVCEDIDECEQSSEVCRKSEVCVNLPGAYDCKSKISQLPKLTTKKCQEGTRLKPGGKACEDIDECREGTHLCDQFQNCINTFGAHECRCKNGYQLDSSSGSCVDIDECALKLDNCAPGQRCLNVLGAFTCTRPPPGPTTEEALPEYEYYYSDEDNSTDPETTNEVVPHPPKPPTTSTTTSTTTTPKPTTTSTTTPKPTTTSTTTTTPKPTTTSTTTTPKPTTTSTTTLRPTRRPYTPYRPYRPPDRSTPPYSPPTPPPTTPTPEPKPEDRRPVYNPYGKPDDPIDDSRKPEDRRPVYNPYGKPDDPIDDSRKPEESQPEVSRRPYTPYRPYRPNTPDRATPPPTTPTTEPPKPDRRPVYNPYGKPDDPIDDSRKPEDRRPVYNPYWKPEDPIDNDSSKPDESQPGYPNRPVYPRRPDDRRPGRVPHRRPVNTTQIPTTTEIPTTTIVASGFNPNDVHCLYGLEKDEYGNCVEARTTPDSGFNPKDVLCPYGSEKDEHGNCVAVGTRPSYGSTVLIDPREVYCLTGFEKDRYGNCADINECERGTHICSNLEQCINRVGGHTCDCLSGFVRAPDGWCAVLTTSTSTTTERPSPNAVDSPPEWSYSPVTSRPLPRGRVNPTTCELGFSFDSAQGKCVDIDECAKNTDTCSALEDCENFDGGFKCVCGSRCRAENEKPSFQPFQPQPADSHVITVGSQYGQRGPWSQRPEYSRSPGGHVVISCPWGYKLTPEKRCYDIDECANNSTSCGPEQRCENFNGGYSCQCPGGHRLVNRDQCVDIDECSHGSPCSYNARCINTVGSYRCECSEGFRNAPSNDKVCEDVNECAETPNVCEQSCANAWGGYRCYCSNGYRLAADNRTCTDVNECVEWSSLRNSRAKLCGGECVNQPGSYRCACPAGYTLSQDQRSCIDIDECENGEASCARASELGHVCQNTRGGYHCHQIECPSGYRLESKHRCSRIVRSCAVSDWACLQQPGSYSYNFITFVANIYIPSGSVDLFTMHGPSWTDSVVSFEMTMVRVQASRGVTPADLRCFDMRPSGNVCVISLLCSLEGPQTAELELSMSLHQHGMFAGSTVARLVVIVSQYEF